MKQTLEDMLSNGIKDLSALEDLGKDLKEIKTTQIRKFFGSMRQIQADFGNRSGEIIMLEPRLAYAKGKAKKESQPGLDKLYKSLSPLIKKIDNDKAKFDSFVRIVEAIVAYHKYYGGQE
ncbi:type III-A CRISPR-associated protein Csm2 [Flectobacillus sp. BAB-3569]|uniref:type III-A CRISPR-associated protein Csm2 n=1 Tax=Flectobacillus sp. BAB-3569 TaxID=1509483 RepID=UPI000BA44CD6|nr:type III-A CRISPR-associated protein Csm2 [Flectobacillus sp. BAB-3569]PAC26456.1 type III-A CRISPR-associated protein Csm2 [Flectobacillus sp. BAB-3569]